jgi:hypothetical protein
VTMRQRIARDCVHLACLGLLMLGGCAGRGDWLVKTKGGRDGSVQPVPEPVNLLLPTSIRIHPFTGRTFAEAGGISGIDVRIEALDYFGDPTKAFGDFRFELYDFIANRLDPKGNRVGVWDVPLLEPSANMLHWDKITRLYVFKLQWPEPIPVGKRVVLVATFDSPFTTRLSDESQFVSGQ